MLPRDKIEKYKGCLIQRGHHNDRIYLMHITPVPSTELSYELIDMAKENGYSKIFAKVPKSISGNFFNAGYLEEARIPDFISGKEAAVFMGYYLDPKRRREPEVKKIEEILEIAFKKKKAKKISCLENRFVLRKCNEADVNAMANLYKKVFPSYPFPIHNPEYLLKTMHDNIDYFGIEKAGSLVAVSSAEADITDANVEMTDFATLPRWRGKGFGQHLLARMEKKMKNKKIKTAYTIARAMSPGMNVTFSKAGYWFGGRLKNNTNISGKIESMNVWYKAL